MITQKQDRIPEKSDLALIVLALVNWLNSPNSNSSKPSQTCTYFPADQAYLNSSPNKINSQQNNVPLSRRFYNGGNR